MKRNSLSTGFVAALIFTSLFCTSDAGADNAVHLDIQMQNIVWTPTAGTMNWLSPWELEVSAAIFDSQNGFTNGYKNHVGQPANVAATATTSLMSAGGTAQVDTSGNIVSLLSFLDETVTPGVTLTAFSAANAYREFEITGGIGSVPVNFGFDYSGLFQSTAGSGHGMDYTALLRISDGVNQWDLMSYELFSDLGNHPFGGTLSQSFTLQYNTPYSISLITDPETPEPETVRLLALGIALWASLQILRARGHGKGAISSESRRAGNRTAFKATRTSQDTQTK